mmetsp:Transcript_24657/g.40159  ORF Transcript_24657/g.40159 Transcript_24657/m.40159 type:complete len:292 (-) Transcript_24657:275-1150(-)|eukprot:CAMPEP_0196144226 /NCGR_PEP_ID=MMETSP0910-20130528/15531_1 /TAXON_ID=49265 /ORGANISM="Thalassiosira rotula, Strain GSO102" /LENGTH=291 /DNA_ID=CAMNT_0041405825 /DNA_START=183 /DNA_END=1058 /DNA_ORIENTATION=+
MARGRTSHGGGGGALLACNRAIERQDDYKKNIKTLHIRTKQLAEALRSDGRIAEVLNAESEDGVADNFLSSTHNRLKAIAEGNAKRMYEIEYFVDSVKEVRTEVENENQGDAEEGNNNDAPDYERSIHDIMDRIRHERESDPSHVAPEDHDLSRELREALGEKVPKKKSRPSRGGDDDEDDLEIVHNRTDDITSLKCPVTGLLFENPVRNKVCSHTYDKAGLAQLLNNRKYNCPIPGCSNKSLSLSQVEEDEEMILKVKRYKVRVEAEKRKRELEDDDDMEGEGGGFTVLE